MTNLFKRFFTHKSKFLLIILCLFGMVFSYSCSCRDNPYKPGPDDDDKKEKVDPTVFFISTSSVETRLVQKADGSGFNYQPSIKFSEANGNQFTVSYEVTDEAVTFKTENTTYDTATGNITFTDLSSLTTSKKSITITFTVKANDTTLQNPETNFTINVDLKKTAGPIDTKEHIGKIFKQVFTFTPTGFPFSVRFESDPTLTEITASTSGTDSGKNKGEVKFNKNNFITSLKSNLEETAKKSDKSKITYKKMELINDEMSSNDTWVLILSLYLVMRIMT